MMKLILSLTLIWMLSSTADALRCLYTDLGNLRVNQTCDSDGDMCAFIPGLSYDLNGQNSSSIVRSCVPSSLCTNPKQKFSFRLGPNVAISSVHCCNTDYCNSQNVSNPEAKLQKNGLQCASCSSPRNDASCNVTVDCMGDQDRCINGTAEIQEFTYRFLGCASASMCQAFSELRVRSALAHYLNFTSAPMCNSAWTAKLSVGPLLLGLIARIVY